MPTSKPPHPPLAPNLALFSRGQSHTLGRGGHFAQPRADGFRDTPSGELRALIAAVEGGTPWKEAVTARYAAGNPWLHKIVTDASRTAFFNLLDLSAPGWALDIGSGWGQIARPMAASKPVVALEPVAERMAFIRAAARQDGVDTNMAFVEADYLDITFATPFTTICAIGVLEWAGAFQNDADPQERQQAFLRKTRGELAPGGALLLGIENRLGLKYLLGAPDDHLGAPGIACLDAALARERWLSSSGHTLASFTYSRAELEKMLRAAGYTDIAFFAAFPDYKLPALILPLDRHGAALNQWLLQNTPPPDHNGYDGSALAPDFQQNLISLYRSLAEEGIAQSFVPSFFVRAK
jgi:2-polyprenyl-3-methyl-5-hydroxy-6-metoxy-1,4-benzoquinol methylase